MTKREIFGVVAALVLFGSSEQRRLEAQESAARMTTAAQPGVNSRLVNIPVVVYDKKGQLVANLTKDNFALEVDKKPREIVSFNHDTNVPLTLGLLVDVSMSQHDVIDDERAGSAAFLNDMLTAGRDKGFILQFARQVDLLQDTTGSKPLLQAALKALATDAGSGEPRRDKASVTDAKDSSTDQQGRRAGVTALYDAVFLSSDEVMGKQQGRKAIIILSDGVDSGSKESLGSAIEAAQRADVVVYAIYYKGRVVNRGFDGRDQDRQGSTDPGAGGYPGGGYPGGGGYPNGGGYPGSSYPGSGGGYPGGGQRKQQEAPRPDGRKTLERIADETGGRLFEVNKKDTLAGIYKEIGDELRSQYRLGYVPDKETASEGYHRIVLTPKPKELYLQTRDGYFGKD